MKMIYAVSLGVAAAVLITGCGNNSSTSAQTPAATNTTASSDSGKADATTPGYLGSLVQAKKFSEKQVDLAYVRQGIQMYQVSEGHYPTSLQDLVPNYIGKVPEAPVGYKISYNPTNGEVKVEKE